jgi:biotin carboxylase
VARILLILPSATYRAHDFTVAAARLGAELVVASDRRQAMSEFLGDRALVLPLGRPAEAARKVVEHAARIPLDAVVAVDDQGIRTASLAAAELGLKTSDPDAVARTRDKAAMRAALSSAGVPQPAWALVGDGERPGFPVVVKPLSLSASRGVIRADDEEEFDAAVTRIRAMLDSPEDALLVESFVPGAEVAVEGLLRGGELEPLAVFDKPDPLEGPYFEETIYVTPSRLPAETLVAVEATTAAAAAALGLTEGPIHAELRVGPDGGVTLLELAARSIGGLCSRALRFGAGVSLEEVILRHALDEPLSGLERADAASGVMMLPIPRAGVLREVRGQDAARAVPGIVGLDIGIAPGRPVEPLPEGDRYLGFLFARGETPAEVERALRDASALLDVDIRDAAGADAA